MPKTYEPIATYTVPSAQASYTFSSIPSTYTDLRLVMVNRATTTAGQVSCELNADTASNYSVTRLYGTGSVAGSDRLSNRSNLILSAFGSATAGIFTTQIVDFFSYTGSTFKTILCRDNCDRGGSGGVSGIVGLWRSTSAITSINIFIPSNDLATGSTFTLYGIKAA